MEPKRRRVAADTSPVAQTSPVNGGIVESDLFSKLSTDAQQRHLLGLLGKSSQHTRAAIYSHLQADLRCDILGRLPGELGTLIIQHLPISTIRQLPTVSSQWRRCVDSDAQLWLRLIVAEGWGERMQRDLRSFSSRVADKFAEKKCSKLYDFASSHPYKQLFIRYYTIRQNWKRGYPVEHTAFPAHGSAVVTALLLSRNRIISASDDAVISIHTVCDGSARKRQLMGHEGGVWCLQLCDGPERLPLAYRERQLLEDRSAQLISRRGSNTLISGSTDRSFRVWDLERGRCLAVIAGHSSTVRCLIVVSRPVDWASSLPAGSPLRDCDNSNNSSDDCKDCRLADDEVLLVTGSRDTLLKVWAVPLAPPPPRKSEIRGTCDPVEYLSSSSDRNNAAHSENHISAAIYNNDDGDRDEDAAQQDNDDYGVPNLMNNLNRGESSPSSPPTETPLSPSDGGKSAALSKRQPRCLMTLSGHTQSVRCLAADFPFIISGSYDGKVRVWRLDEGRCSAVLLGHTDKVYSVALDRKSDRCFSGSLDCTVRVWNIKSGACLHTLEGHTDLVGLLQHRYLPFRMQPPRVPQPPRPNHLNHDDDDAAAAAASASSTIAPVKDHVVHSGGKRKRLSIVESHEAEKSSKFPLLISAAADRTLMLWDSSLGSETAPKPLKTLFGHQSAITSFDFDCEKAVSGSEGAVKLWDIRRGGKFVRNLVTGIRGTWRVAIDDSRCVVSVQRNEGTWIEVFDFDPSHSKQ